MLDEEIKQKVANLKPWHYEFDLGASVTPIRKKEKVSRHGQRKAYFFDPLVQLCGGSLEGKRVLDLACNAGFWSLNSVHAGCDYVLGIDGRQMHIDQANLVFEANGIDGDRHDFIEGDIFETDLRQFGRFDVVLCLGLMYHISKHVELLEKISDLNTDILVVDTLLSTLPGSVLEIDRQDVDNNLSALDYNLAMKPSGQAMRELVELFGYSVSTLEPDFRDEAGNPSWTGAPDYERGARRAFVCSKKTDLSSLPAESGPA